MLPTPTKFTLVAGKAEGPTRLNAFDNALLNAGVGNLNLVRVSSILPPAATYVERVDIPYGSLVPMAYGSIVSSETGKRICAGIGVGISPKGYGIIMEYSGEGTARSAEEAVKQMVEEAFRVRGLHLKEIKVKAEEHVVQETGAVFAGAALWY